MALASNRDNSWETRTLGEVLREVNLRASDVPEEATSAGVLSLTKNLGLIPQSERFDKRIATADVSRYKVVRKGWLVYNPYVLWEGAIHALKTLDIGLVSPVYHVWQSQGASTGFLDYLLRTPEMLNAYLRVAQGTVKRRRAVRTSSFKKLPISLPVLQEQEAIARALDIVQRAKDVRQRELALERERKAALMEYIFTHGTRGDPTKQTEIGDMPQTWTLRETSDVCERITDGTHDTPRQTVEGELLVTAVHIKKGKLDLKDAYRISAEDFKKINERSKVDRFDVLMTMIGAFTGEVAFVSETPRFAIKNVGLFKTAGNRDLGLWLSYFFQSKKFQRYLEIRISGTSQPYAPLWLLRSFPIPIASDAERREIISALSACDAKIQSLEREVSLHAELFGSILKELMTGRLSARPMIEEHQAE